MDSDVAARIEAELRAIRKLFEERGLRLQPTAVNFEEAARLLSVSPKHVSRMVRRGELRASSIGGARRISMAEIQRVLDAGRPTEPKRQKAAPRFDATAARARLAALRKKP